MQGPLLLQPQDPPAVAALGLDSASPLLLVCEHAGQAIPAQLGDLGLPPGAIDLHIGWDIGARVLAERMSQLLSAPLIEQRYSRLVIDCNRPPEVPSSIPEVSDQIAITGNQGLSSEERQARRAEIFTPFHKAVAEEIASGRRRLLATIHSYTPALQGEERRPWEIGLLFNRDDRLSKALLPVLQAARPGLVAAFNQPYSVDDESDYTIPVHGEQSGLPHVLIELRNDLLATPAGVDTWARLLGGALAAVMDRGDLKL
ncbi:MAG: N-formylglutamate amidohydrolase [Pseudomonadota bacterium]